MAVERLETNPAFLRMRSVPVCDISQGLMSHCVCVTYHKIDI